VSKQTVSCKCGFTDEYEPNEFGLSYYQANGTCPRCGADLGTAVVIEFRAVNGQPQHTEESPVKSPKT